MLYIIITDAVLPKSKHLAVHGFYFEIDQTFAIHIWFVPHFDSESLRVAQFVNFSKIP